MEGCAVHKVFDDSAIDGLITMDDNAVYRGLTGLCGMVPAEPSHHQRYKDQGEFAWCLHLLPPRQ